MSRLRRPAVGVAAVIAIAACSGPDDGVVGAPERTAPPPSTAGPVTTESSPDTTPPPTATPPDTDAPAPTTTAGGSDAWHRSIEPVVDDDVTCTPGWAPLGADDEVTFARDGDVVTWVPATGELRCIARLAHDPARLDWNPAGDRLLVDGDVVSATGRHASGFEPGTAGLSWSHPIGTALIAPATDGSSLRHVDADDPTAQLDVGALTTTWAAAYHPSGLAIVSAGIGQDGTAGLFLADNRGDDAGNLAFLDEPATTITAVAFAHNGDWVTFVHDHAGAAVDEGAAAHIHRLHLGDLWIEDVVTLPDVVPEGLIASEQFDGSIAWVERRAPDDVRTHVWAGGEPRRLGDPQVVVEPVGFYERGTALALVTPVDDPSAGADLWAFPREGDPVLIARGVTAAATRTVHHPVWSPPPLRIDQRAVG